VILCEKWTPESFAQGLPLNYDMSGQLLKATARKTMRKAYTIDRSNIKVMFTIIRRTLFGGFTAAIALTMVVNSEELLTNGNFETGDLTGWTTSTAGNGLIRINDGTLIFSGGGPIPPCDGTFSAVFHQNGPSRNSFLQEVTVPGAISKATLSWTDAIRNNAAVFQDPNQEYRVQIRNSTGTLLREVFSTNPGDNLINPCTNRSFEITEFAGQTIQVFFEAQDNLFFFPTQLDNISLDITRRRSNTNPVISAIPDQTVFGASVIGPISFTVSDIQTSPSELRVTASSSNRNLIENQNILLSGAGTNRSLLITNIARTGTFAEITVSVFDLTGAVTSTTFSVTSFSGPSILVDDLDEGFSTTGPWQQSAATDEFKGSSLVSLSGGGTATFNPGILTPGDYRVFAWWAGTLPGGRRALRSPAAQYVVNHNDASDSARIDQAAVSGEWVELGKFSFSGTGDETVTLSGTEGGAVSADAVAFVEASTTGNIGDIVIDNLDIGFSASTGWSESGVVKEFSDSSLSSFSPLATASWTPSLPAAGNYNIFVWLSRETRGGRSIPRAENAEYEISHSGRTTVVAVDQNGAESGNWTLLGTFAFDGGGVEKITLLAGSANYSTGSIGADAMRFSPIASSQSVDLIVDNLDAGFAVAGVWEESAALDEFNGSSVYSQDFNGIVKWNFPGTATGQYQVFVWNSARLAGGRVIPRNNAARYLIQSSGRSSLVILDQNADTGKWVSIGEFNFSGTGGESVSLVSLGTSTVADAVRFVKLD
jgi:hypothetical protein